MKDLFALIFLLLLSVFGTMPAIAAQDPAAIATVVAVRGQVTATSQAGVSRPLAIKDPLFVEDTLRTGKQGRIQLLFNDATIISLATDTEMNLAEYQWDAKAKTGVMKTKVKEGTFRVMGGALTQFAPKNFTTETPTATIGIRGSMYAGTATAKSLSVVFQGGRGIDVTNAAGTVALTRPGFGTHVRGRDQPPSPPQKFSPAELGAINEALTGMPTDEKPNAQGDKPDAAPDDESADDSQGADGGDEAAPDGEPFTDLGSAATTDDPGLGSPLSDLARTPLSAAAPLRAYYDPTTDPGTPPEVIQQPLPPPPPPPPPVNMPTTGISHYTGPVTGADSGPGGAGVIDDIFSFDVNWHNGQAIGTIIDKSSTNGGKPVYFIGSVQGDSLTNVRVFGSDSGNPSGSVNDLNSAILGTGTGRFSGTDADLIKGSASGGDFTLARPGTPQIGKWDITLEGTRTSKEVAASPTGGATWDGFAVVLAENVTLPNYDPKIFMNTIADSAAEGFFLALDKDAGTFSGSLKAPQLDRVYNGGIDLAFGGKDCSAYVDDHRIAAFIDCPTGDCITGDTITPDPNIQLNAYGNFMVSADQTEQFSEYATWGYWETSHQESNGDMYHAQAPHSMWIAGERTPDAYVKRLIDRTSFVGTYNGMAQGSQINMASNQATKLTNGRSFLSVDFSQADAADAVQGSLIFDQVTLPFTSPEFGLSPHGFKADIITPDISGNVNGAFFGPKANAVGGNFQAKSEVTQYIGIFGAKLINKPPL